MDQPPRRQRQREQQQQIGQQRGDRDRPALRPGPAEERPQAEDQAGDRQIDQPRPVDVRAERRVQPILAKVEPVLPVEQRADLHDPHVVVGIAEAEPADLGPFAEHVPGAEAEPDEQHDQLPPPLEQLERARFPFPYLAFGHFSRCSRWT